MEKMNRKELIDEVAERAYLSKKEAETAVDTVFEVIIDALKEGKTVLVPKFMVFSTKTRKERSGVNPKSHTSIVVPEKRSVSVKVSRVLKEEINK